MVSNSSGGDDCSPIFPAMKAELHIKQNNKASADICNLFEVRISTLRSITLLLWPTGNNGYGMCNLSAFGYKLQSLLRCHAILLQFIFNIKCMFCGFCGRGILCKNFLYPVYWIKIKRPFIFSLPFGITAYYFLSFRLNFPCIG